MHAPVMNVQSAAGALEKSPKEVEAMIDSGAIIWAWNLARQDVFATEDGKREIRILTRCVRDLQQQQETSVTEEEAIRLVLGSRLEFAPTFIRGSRLALRLWFCSTDHVVNLCKDGSLQIAPGTSWQRGRGGSPVITWDSAAQFLKTRRMT